MKQKHREFTQIVCVVDAYVGETTATATETSTQLDETSVTQVCRRSGLPPFTEHTSRQPAARCRTLTYRRSGKPLRWRRRPRRWRHNTPPACQRIIWCRRPT